MGETVWIHPVVSGPNRSAHLSTGCKHVDPSKAREIDRETAVERMGLDICEDCSGVREQTKSPDFSAYNALVDAARRADGG